MCAGLSLPDSGRVEVERRALLHQVAASHPAALADVVATLSRSVRSAPELTAYLQDCLDLTLRVVAGAAGATIVVNTPATAAVVTSVYSGPAVAHVEQSSPADQSPGARAARTGRPVSGGVVASRERWPQFAGAAQAAGFTSYLSLPLAPDDPSRVGGAVTVYSSQVEAPGTDGTALPWFIAFHTARAVNDYHRLHAAEQLADQLSVALDRRGVIEQAKGIVMAARHLDADAAFAALRKQSQDTNIKLHQLCIAFIQEYTGPGNHPTGSSPPPPGLGGR